MKYGVRKMIPARVGMMSLIGVGSERPCSWGNYFDFFDGYRCVNMWAENLTELVRNGTLNDGMIEVVLFTNDKKYTWAVVDDKRIPSDDWYYNKFCFTGGSSPSKEFAEEMYSIHGDPTNELERFIDPKSYYAKRGGEYIETDDGYAFVKYNTKSQSRTISSKYTIENTQIISMNKKDLLEETYEKLIENLKSNDQ